VEAWLLAGGPHQMVLSRSLGSEAFDDLAEIAGLELVLIDERTHMSDLRKELRWNQAYFRLAGGL
jgi:L-arabinose isomerase